MVNTHLNQQKNGKVECFYEGLYLGDSYDDITLYHITLYYEIVATSVSISASPSNSVKSGTSLNIRATVTANPAANTTRWQRKAPNGSWCDIDIAERMYTGSSVTPASPVLVISSVPSTEDNVAFRCVVGNDEGETTSNEITISVTEGMYYLMLTIANY